MPWRPSMTYEQNPRLDPYRHRAARFTDGAGRRGRFYVQPDGVAHKIGGHLWWTRWSPPQEMVALWVETADGYDTDAWILPDDLHDELSAWDREEFQFLGETYQLTWLDDSTTQSIRRALGIDIWAVRDRQSGGQCARAGAPPITSAARRLTWRRLGRARAERR